MWGDRTKRGVYTPAAAAAAAAIMSMLCALPFQQGQQTTKQASPTSMAQTEPNCAAASVCHSWLILYYIIRGWYLHSEAVM
jgi:hypothetical protein